MSSAYLTSFPIPPHSKVYKVYVDEGFSGKDTKRPAFNEMMIAAQRREFDILAVWKFDRLSRSLKDLS